MCFLVAHVLNGSLRHLLVSVSLVPSVLRERSCSQRVTEHAQAFAMDVLQEDPPSPAKSSLYDSQQGSSVQDGSGVGRAVGAAEGCREGVESGLLLGTILRIEDG